MDASHPAGARHQADVMWPRSRTPDMALDLAALSAAGLVRAGSFVDGRFLRSGGREVVVRNPADGGDVWRVASATAGDAERAAAAAAAALPLWRDEPSEECAALLLRWARLVRDAADDLAAIITLENGKTLRDARAEVAYGAAYMEWYAAEVVRAHGTCVTELTRRSRGVLTREPVGVVLAVTPSNFPFAMLARKAAGALAAGCTVVAKPCARTPLTALAACELLRRAGAPAGVLNVLVVRAERAADVVAQLLRADAVRMVSLTGGGAAGRAVAAAAAPRLVRVALELGSEGAPFVVLDGADVAHAVRCFVAAKFRCAGQTCIAPDRVLVQDGVLDEFVSGVVAEARRINDRVGDGMHEDTLMGPLLSAADVRRMQRLVADALARGAVREEPVADVVHGVDPAEPDTHADNRPEDDAQLDRARVLVNGVSGTPVGYPLKSAPAAPADAGRAGYFYPATVLTGVTPDMAAWREEVFGPLVCVRPCASAEDALARAQPRAGGLAAYVFGPATAAEHVARALDVGMAAVNSIALSDPRTPFGGVGAAGEGREGGEGLAAYTVAKYVVEAWEAE